jgi:hypothetical protein
MLAGLPQINDLYGNSPEDPTQIFDGMVIKGDYLDGASFHLQSQSEMIALNTRNQNANEAEILLPSDIHSGEYLLVVSNEAGSNSQSLALTLPELDGQLQLERLNNEATGTLGFHLFPIGQTAQTLAAGDHDHAEYLTEEEANALYATNVALNDFYNKTEIDALLATLSSGGQALTGNDIVTLLNSGVTETIDISALPVGQSDQSLARGDHDHDENYYGKSELYTKNEIDALLATLSGDGEALDADSLMTLLNTNASIPLVTALLPIGTSSAEVAAGDHAHDELYYTQDIIDANYFTQTQINSNFVTQTVFDATVEALASANTGNPQLGDNYILNSGLEPDSELNLFGWSLSVSGLGSNANYINVGTAGHKSNYVLENADSTLLEVSSESRTRIDFSATYRFSGMVRQSAGGSAGAVSLGVRFYDNNNNVLSQIAACEDFDPGNIWQKCSVSVGSQSANAFPGAATSISVYAMLNEDAGGYGNRNFQVQGLELYRVASKTLLQTNPGGAMQLKFNQDGIALLSPDTQSIITLPQEQIGTATELRIINKGSAKLTIQAADGSYFFTLFPESFLNLLATSHTPTSNTDWTLLERSSVHETLNADGTWTVPQGITSVELTLVSGGGGGAGGDADSGNDSGGGGGGGGSVVQMRIPVIPGQAYDFNVGSGGAAGTKDANNAGNGGATTFASDDIEYRAYGGNKGQFSDSNNGGNGGAGGGTILRQNAQAGGDYSSSYGGTYPGGNAGKVNGGGGGGAIGRAAGQGASTIFASGGNGGPGCSSDGGGGGGGASMGAGGHGSCNAGQAGSFPGGGGAGGAGNRNGGAGADGVIYLAY